MRRKRGTCTYCGRVRKLTDDHVPPKLFLAKPYPPNLVTVPACRSCNESFQHDDEYTRLIICHHPDVARNPVGRLLAPAAFRSLQKPQAAAFARYVESQRSLSLLFGPDGSRIAVVTADRRRIDAVGARLIRGLFFADTGRRLPATAKLRCAAKYGLPPEKEFHEFVKLWGRTQVQSDRAIGDGFSYVAGFYPQFSVWMLMLYEVLMWFGTVEYKPAAARD
jgi:hypothetical protein